MGVKIGYDPYNVFTDTPESICQHLKDSHLPRVEKTIKEYTGPKDYTLLPLHFNLEHIFFLGGELEGEIVTHLRQLLRKKESDWILKSYITGKDKSLRERLNSLETKKPLTVNTILTENLIYGNMLGVLPNSNLEIDTSFSLRDRIDRTSYLPFTRESEIFPPFFSLLQLGSKPLKSYGVLSTLTTEQKLKQSKAALAGGVRLQIGENYIVPYDSQVGEYFGEIRPLLIDFTAYCKEEGIPSYHLYPSEGFKAQANRYDPKLVRKIMNP